MTRKIEISNTERTLIASALVAYFEPQFALEFSQRFDAADPANDGPEVDILREDPNA